MKACALVLAAWALTGSVGAESWPQTTAQRTDYRQTGRYAEVERLCQAYQKRWPAWVRCERFGITPEGRPMLALVVTQQGALQPSPERPVLMIQGGIHAGEIDGKDAGFEALPALLQAGAFKDFTLVFVPVFNVDGHERFGRWNRPNQVGPEEMGWRVTSQNLNLNRDYAKADSPEMRAMLRLLNRWNPVVYVDLHVTDGSQFQPDIAILVEPIFMGDPALHEHGKLLQSATLAALKSSGSMPLPFYPSLRDARQPTSGFSDDAYTPRFSTGYWPLSNRLAMLVETHSWKDYKTRVAATRHTIEALAQLMNRHGRIWLQAAQAADKRSQSLSGAPVTLTYRTTDRHEMLDFPGYAYSHEQSPAAGVPVLRYDPSRPQTWRVPFYGEVVPQLQVNAPQRGYLIPPAYKELLLPRLQAHGIRTESLPASQLPSQVQVFRADKVELSKTTSEGHTRANLSGRWQPETQTLAPGTLLVPLAQPKARLVLALFEPQAPDSFAAWGFFNAHYELKEYMEEYVLDQVAREMLLQRPDVAQAFQQRLASDPAFAQDPQARLEFFYRYHPAWDSRYNLYPVMRY